MPENTSIDEQLATLQQEYEAKRRALEEQQASPESGQGHPEQKLPPEKEIFHEVVGEQIERAAPSPESVGDDTDNEDRQARTPQPHADEEPSYLEPELKETVQKLVTDLFTAGLDKTIAEVHKINNSAVTKAFHQAITNELFPIMVERGLIKELKG